VPVVEGVDHVVVSSVCVEPLTRLTVSLIVCVVVLSVVAVVLACIIICRRHQFSASAATQRHLDRDDSCGSSASLRTRLSPLHINQLLCPAHDQKLRSSSGAGEHHKTLISKTTRLNDRNFLMKMFIYFNLSTSTYCVYITFDEQYTSRMANTEIKNFLCKAKNL